MELFWVGMHDEKNTTSFIFAKDHEEAAEKFYEEVSERPSFNFKLNDLFEQDDMIRKLNKEEVDGYRIKVVKEDEHV